MKYINNIIICLSFMMIIACRDAEYSIIDNEVYISSAASNVTGSETIVMNDGADVTVLLRLAKAVDYDVKIELTVDSELLKSFNDRNQTEYLLAPNYDLKGIKEVIIPAGQISSSHTIHVDDFETNGNQFALPIKIARVTNGNISLANTHSKFIYTLAKPLNVSVPVMSGVNNAAVNALPESDWGINVNEWSLECWSMMNGFRRNNQAIFNLGSSQHEIYIRYGDANSPYNYLQIKTLGGQIQTASNLQANKWYHWTFVYDGNTLTVYRDGEVDVKFQPPAPLGGSVRMDYLQMVSSGSSWFVNNGHLAQVKLWKKAISQTQIKNNMYFEANPKNPDLIAYWPMNEGEGNVFKDLTGNGHDAEAGTNIIKSWEHNVNFQN